MTDEQAQPLDLDAIEKRANEVIGIGLALRAERRLIGEDVPALLAEVRALRAALAHYANEQNWAPGRQDGLDDYYQPYRNGYDAARAALGRAEEDR